MKSMSMLTQRPVVLIVIGTGLILGSLLVMPKRFRVGLASVARFVGGPFAARSPGDENDEADKQTMVVTTPAIEDVILTDSFVCQIRSQRHIDVCTLDGGYIEHIWINEGQSVKKGDKLFDILPVLYKAKVDAENARANVAQQKYQYTQQLAKNNVVSENELSLAKAEMDEAVAKANFARAELNFTNLTAPFDGIVDRLLQREGSLVKEGDVLTTLADNSVMWVYFNVPEKFYLHYMATRQERETSDTIELVLANGETFPQPGKIGAIEADFNNQNGNIKFRADFPNPAGLLRHGQTGTIKIRRPLKDVIVIPQRATFELLDKRYVWRVDDKDVVHQNLITIRHELEDIFVIESGLAVTDKFILEGVREAEEGETITYRSCPAKEALSHQKFHAE
jgi:membrane fusion protein (multidrug efflux system)